MTRPRLVDNATWTRKATSDLRYEEKLAAEAPVRASDDPRERRIADLVSELPTRILWHATDGGGADASIHEWQVCAISSKNCGTEWSHGSGYYMLYHEDHEVPNIATHYRAPGDREDARPSSGGPRDPDAEYRRAQAEFWARHRVDANDMQAEIGRLRSDLGVAQSTIATHLDTITQKDARILALEQERVPEAPEQHWFTPVAAQLGGFMEEIKPYAGPAFASLAPIVRAAAQDHLSGGAYTAGVLERVERARSAFHGLIVGVSAVYDRPAGFGLRIPEPSEDAVVAHHCPVKACEAESGEPCMDEAGHPTEPHKERWDLARMPAREVRTMLRKHKIEIVDLAELVPAPGAVVAADSAVVQAASDLDEALEMDGWRQQRHEREQAQAQAQAQELGAEGSEAATEAPEATTEAPAPPKRVIVDAEIEETEPAERSVRVSLTPEEETPEDLARATSVEDARKSVRVAMEKMNRRRAEIEAERAKLTGEAEEEPPK